MAKSDKPAPPVKQADVKPADAPPVAPVEVTIKVGDGFIGTPEAVGEALKAALSAPLSVPPPPYMVDTSAFPEFDIPHDPGPASAAPSLPKEPSMPSQTPPPSAADQRRDANLSHEQRRSDAARASADGAAAQQAEAAKLSLGQPVKFYDARSGMALAAEITRVHMHDCVDLDYQYPNGAKRSVASSIKGGERGKKQGAPGTWSLV